MKTRKIRLIVSYHSFCLYFQLDRCCCCVFICIMIQPSSLHAHYYLQKHEIENKNLCNCNPIVTNKFLQIAHSFLSIIILYLLTLYNNNSFPLAYFARGKLFQYIFIMFSSLQIIVHVNNLLFQSLILNVRTYCFFKYIVTRNKTY